jgi:hypothetical protein
LTQRLVSALTRDELRNSFSFRPHFTMGELPSLSQQRRAFLDRLTALKEEIRAIS